MKKVISGNELREVMQKSINLICDAVSSTLGPSGNNVLIDSGDASPFITNDGVTIASSISSEDKRCNAILEIIKEATLKTNEVVGDGTTTTLVLLQSIFNNGVKKIESGINPITLKKELDNSLNDIILKLKKKSKKPTKKDYISIASISSNDKDIGTFLENVYSIMGSVHAIKLKEGSEKTYYEIKKGYSVDVDVPNIYFDDKKEINLDNAYILLLKGYLNDLEAISDIINEGLNRNKNIVILADDYDIDVSNQVVLYNLQMNKNIYLFKLPDYGSRKDAIEKDISILTNSKIKNIEYDNISFSSLGIAKEIVIKKDEIIIISDKDINKWISKIKDNYNNETSDYEKEFLAHRIAMLENGIATIYVGGMTKTEIKEKLMRFEDSLNALEVANNGILIGEGISLLKISDEINNDILKESLKVPFKKIMENALGEYKDIENSILNSNYNLIYNFDDNKLEDISNTSILDPLNVTIEALKNAVSIAGMLLTTNYIVINEMDVIKDTL